jgi:uncharacterized Zn finger protein
MKSGLKCPKCGSTNMSLYMGGQMGLYQCLECGYVGPIGIRGPKR